MGIREKYGITYVLESGYTPYRMSGNWSVIWATEPAKMERTRSLIFKELKRLAYQPLGSMQWHKATQQIMGQLALSNENAGNMLQIVARSILLHDEIETLASVFERLQALKPQYITAEAEALFETAPISECYYYPEIP
jgi:predicted Zn-dependent peptidase